MASANSFSLRDWMGLVAGICWGLILSRFFDSDDMTGPWLVILFGPPLVLLISSERPILSWQLPIVTAIVAGTFVQRAPEDSAGLALLEAALMWLVCSVFSLPWALIFHYRARRLGKQTDVGAVSASYVGLGLLVFFTCALTLLGFAATVYPITSADGQGRRLPLYGLLMATGGIVLSIVSARTAQKLEVHKPVRAILDLIMIPGILVGVAELVACLGWFDAPGSIPMAERVSGILVGLEALGAMIWMTRADRRAQNSSLKSDPTRNSIADANLNSRG
jgi:hypothetical protein